MFRGARLKLAAWYLLIIMLISIAFSGFIYRGISTELERGFIHADLMLRARELDVRLPRRMPHDLERLNPKLGSVNSLVYLQDEFDDARAAVVLRLFLLNGAILIISAGAGYVLAGRTLKPIEETMAAQKRFVSDASHELRTPITALKTSIEVNLRDKKISQQAKNLLKDNLDTVDNLSLLTDRLLRMREQKNLNDDLQIEQIKVKDILQTALKQMRPLADKKHIKLKVSIEPQNMKIEADKASLRELFLIFLDNAIKFTPSKKSISVNIISSTKQLVVTIKDNGVGIDKKHLPYIFNRFYRADSSRSKKDSAGFGLGLSLAKSIVDSHHGSIDVESEVKKGTTFIIKMPLKHS